VLIALFERAVGFYGSLVNINAYHQPGVEAGKKAAAAVLDLQNRASAQLSGSPQTAGQLALAIDAVESVETIYLVLEHLAANGRIRRTAGAFPAETTYCQK
jgi:glucose-6-phosphate isomerase